MKRIVIVAAVVLAVAALAFGSFARPAPVRAQGLDQLTGEEFEKAFMRQMIMHHMMAVMMAQPIPDKAVHDELKEVGRTIIRTQSAEVEQMSRWLKGWYGIDAMPVHAAVMGQGGMAGGQGGMMPGMAPGQRMGDTHQGMTQGGQGMGQGRQGDHGMSGMHQGMGMEMMGMVTGLRGPRLEAAFMSLMIPHHEGAISMARLAVDRAAHDDVRDMAKLIVEDQSTEVRQFNEWLAAWYGL